MRDGIFNISGLIFLALQVGVVALIYNVSNNQYDDAPPTSTASNNHMQEGGAGSPTVYTERPSAFDHAEDITLTNIEMLSQDAEPEASCNIKGNISYNTGERIYHLPGQEYYGRTTINQSYGERWFCSEHEAKAGGWRKSKV